MNFAETNHSPTSENEENEEPERPWVKSVAVPESIKRKIPSKHYVYKVVVDWTNGKNIIIYRKYSLFFDFVIKLNQLVAKLYPSEPKKNFQLPELPGRVLFGRTEVHQVAEKRRRKIEEFCQKVIELPPEISRTHLVLGFFNTWPDDTLLKKPFGRHSHVISAPVIAAPGGPRSKSSSPCESVTSSSKLSVTSLPENCTTSSSYRNTSLSPSPPPITSPTTMEAIISHPDEMEHLEQYHVIANYERKDSHQVSLVINQLVHVIEKHDTGWWMVMSDDEQGYAPASFLEPVEGSGSDRDIHPEDDISQVYEAMETYIAENDDEITMKAGDRVDVISKSMDGWWKIRCNGCTGFSPAALIRRKTSIKPTDLENIYESEKSIYEGLNIHRPPPRRNTIDRSAVMKAKARYDIPRTTVPTTHHEANNLYVGSNEGESDEDTPKCYQVAKNTNKVKSIIKQKGASPRVAMMGSSTSSSVDFAEDDHIYEMEPSLEDETETKSSIYENTEFSSKVCLTRKASLPTSLQVSSPPPPPATSPSHHSRAGRTKSTPLSPEHVSSGGRPQPGKGKPLRHTPDDYEDPDRILDMLENEKLVEEVDDYVDMESNVHNTYIDPEDLRRGSSGSITTSSGSFSSAKRTESNSSAPTTTSPKFNGVNSVGLGGTITEPVFDDDYIEMDPLYVEPPLEDGDDDNSDTLKADKHTPPPKGSPVSKRPLPPPPYSGNSPVFEKKSITRTKSLENLIASFESSKNTSPKNLSPESKRKKVPNPPPRIPAPLNRLTSSPAFDLDQGGKPKLHNPTKQNHGSPNGVESPSNSSHSTSKVRGGLPSHPLERSKSPPNGPIVSHAVGKRERGEVPSHHPLQRVLSPPSNEDSSLPKTYVAMSSYTSQTEGCLSFNAGDKCVLIQQKQEGWWLVNIGGREGWTPGEYWKEDTKREFNLPKPPSFAPKKLPNVRKPRSHTVGMDAFTTSLDLPSYNPSKPENTNSSLTQSAEEHLTTSLREPQQGNPPKGPLPPLPSGVQKNKPDRPDRPDKPTKPPKPALPTKPAKPDRTKKSSPSPPSPPNGRKKQHSPPLPPPNLSKNKSVGVSLSNTEVNGHTPNVEGTIPINDYEELDDVSTFSIENAPWFAGKMERAQAEQFLMEHGRQREFLIRERTSKDGFYALSVRYHYNYKHFNIDPKDGQFVMGALTFPSIEQIIQHYQQNSLFIHDGQPVALSQPAKKRSRASDASRYTPKANSSS